MDLRKFFEISSFPDPLTAADDGVLCFGGDLDTETLIDAYIHGIFPWPHEGYPLLWFSPLERGVLDFKEIHVPRSLQKLINKDLYEFRINSKFPDVIDYCAKVPRKDQGGTWINGEMKNAYLKLYDEGHILCVECYRKDNKELVGGVYGVFLAGVFSGESMFGLEDNVSKLCVLEVARILEAQGLEWIDIQMVTPVLESLGGKYISREEYQQRLQTSHKIFLSDDGST